MAKTIMNGVVISIILATLLIVLHAANAPYARFRGSGNCSASPCVRGKEFCGTTNMCYHYSCSSWYRYGPPEYTGHDGTSSVHVDASLWEIPILPHTDHHLDSSTVVELTCSEQDLPEYQASVGVVYGCTGVIGSPPDPVHGMDLYQNFTRSCVARNGQNNFNCYEMSLNTDYTSLRKDAETARKQGLINCSEYNDITTGHFTYQVYLDLKSMGSVITCSYSDLFDENLVQTSMYSYLETIKTDQGSSAPATIMDVSTISLQRIWMCIIFSVIGVIFM